LYDLERQLCDEADRLAEWLRVDGVGCDRDGGDRGIRRRTTGR
jgi:hypothetical protein